MSVLLETSLGDIVIDLEVDTCPKVCRNFIKLCKIYYYNLNAFFNGILFRQLVGYAHADCWFFSSVSKDFLAQTGDPTATGKGGECIDAIIDSTASRYFIPELVPRLKHVQRGTVSMAVAPTADGKYTGGSASQFFITLGDNIEYLDGKHAVFGHVVEGFETLDKLNEVYTDQEGRPLKDIRIRHVIILGKYNPLLL